MKALFSTGTQYQIKIIGKVTPAELPWTHTGGRSYRYVDSLNKGILEDYTGYNHVRIYECRATNTTKRVLKYELKDGKWYCFDIQYDPETHDFVKDENGKDKIFTIETTFEDICKAHPDIKW